MRLSGLNLIILTIITVIFTSLFKIICIFFKNVKKRKLWKEFFITFSSLIMVNYSYYTFLNGSSLSFLFYSFAVFVIIWGVLFIVCNPKYYNSNWVRESYWRSLNAFQFEEETAELFRELGYKAQVTQKTVDFGVDVIVWIKGIKTAVQCKRYNGHPATCSEVRDLWGAKEYYNCKGAIMIALDGITRQGQQFIDKFENYDFMTIHDIIERAEGIYRDKEGNNNNDEFYD